MTAQLTRRSGTLGHLLGAMGSLGLAAVCTIGVINTAHSLHSAWAQILSGAADPLVSISQVVTLGVLALGGIAAAWWLLGYLLAGLTRVTKTGSNWHRRLSAATAAIAPRLVRTTLTTAAGASLILAGSPALAGDQDSTFLNTGFATTQQAPTGHYIGFGPVPSSTQPAPVQPPQAQPAQGSPRATADTTTADSRTATTHTVVPGESLWSITQGLIPSANASRIANLWPQLYEANRAVIGDDPNLIVPGTILQVPAGIASTSLSQN